jgi:hypothetical protein
METPLVSPRRRKKPRIFRIGSLDGGEREAMFSIFRPMTVSTGTYVGSH